MVHINHNLRKSGSHQFTNQYLQQGFSSHRDKRFRHRVRQRLQAGSQPRCKNHSFHICKYTDIISFKTSHFTRFILPNKKRIKTLAFHGIIRIFVKTTHYGCKVERHGRIYRYRHPRICQATSVGRRTSLPLLNHYKAIDFLESQYDVAHTHKASMTSSKV